ncbi:hypothetical protein [Bacillus sp. ISL-47]|uniref:hypothetical protein n=1 Tax=Bacillus sp. ISL-47 TaxID=2819130 RepID=UPI001BEB92DC|nr:hypothetical protein [Bacillus sp. ISL-47]MBT2709018.1 hypothetical protein [Pseudomonas sp. ISL-84]
MMGWVIAILFGSAVVLLILSFFKTTKSKSNLEQQIDQVTFSLKNEIHELQQQIRNIELDAEITAHQSGSMRGTSEERLLLREILDLHKRGYSFESIALKKQLSPNEVERMLLPYLSKRAERSMVAQ